MQRKIEKKKKTQPVKKPKCCSAFYKNKLLPFIYSEIIAIINVLLGPAKMMSQREKNYLSRCYVKQIERKSSRILPLDAKTLNKDSFPSIHIILANMIMVCTVVLLTDIPIYEVNLSLDSYNNPPIMKAIMAHTQ